MKEKHRMHKNPAGPSETITSYQHVHTARDINDRRRATLETWSRHGYAEWVYQVYYFYNQSCR